MGSKRADEETAQPLTSILLIRLIVVYLLIPLVLWASGWDFGWWQAWVFSLLIVAAGIGGMHLLPLHRGAAPPG